MEGITLSLAFFAALTCLCAFGVSRLRKEQLEDLAKEKAAKEK